MLHKLSIKFVRLEVTQKCFEITEKSAVEAYKMKTRTPIVFPSGAASDLCSPAQAFVNSFLFHYDKLLELPPAIVFTKTLTPWDLKMFLFRVSDAVETAFC